MPFFEQERKCKVHPIAREVNKGGWEFHDLLKLSLEKIRKSHGQIGWAGGGHFLSPLRKKSKINTNYVTILFLVLGSSSQV